MCRNMYIYIIIILNNFINTNPPPTNNLQPAPLLAPSLSPLH